MSNESFHFFNKNKSLKITKKNLDNSCNKRELGKENSDNVSSDTENTSEYLEKYPFKKNKIKYNQKKFNIKTKEYHKNGKVTKFNLFKEKEINLNKFDKDIEINDSEKDCDSDNNIIKDGLKKVVDDLQEAFLIMKSKKFKELNNYSKYCKYCPEN